MYIEKIQPVPNGFICTACCSRSTFCVFFFLSDHHLSLTSDLLFLANAKGDICTVCFYSGSPSERGYLYSVFLFRQPKRKEISVQYVFIQAANATGDICTVCFYSGSQSERGCVCTVCFYSGSQSERGYLYSMFLVMQPKPQNSG